VRSALAGIERWLVEEFASRLTSAIEAMAGTRASIRCNSLASAPPAGGLQWRQPIVSIPGAILIAAAEESWSSIGHHVLNSAGVEDSEPGELKSTCLDLMSRALSGVGEGLSERLHREVSCTGGKETAEFSLSVSWTNIEIALGETPVAIAFGLEPAFLEALVPVPQQSSLATTADELSTFDLLLDVELPVTVSFGHAQVLLKDVLKLTTGSILELDRALVEPVDIVVNNCVIAHGEVVVVEGNFGVRIQHVVSREERVRTLR